MYPKGSKRLSGRVNFREVQKLKEALSAARLENCCCSEAAKNEMRNYLSSWVAGPIQQVLNGLEARQRKRESIAV
jgi:hypothetical protein